MLSKWLSQAGLVVMGVLARLPLRWVRALGWCLGQVLYLLAVPRRHVAMTNWRVCFPALTEAECKRGVKAHFVVFAQAWLDRGWLWGAPADTVKSRVKLVGCVEALAGDQPTLLFAPHFVGMDAGWMGLTVNLERRFCGLYAPQTNQVVDAWMASGRQRFGNPKVVAKFQGLKAMASALREGLPLYLLPDMDHGMGDSVMAQFFGTPAATLTSLPRFAKLGKAKVVPVVSRLTPGGYEVRVLPAWQNYPTDDVLADVQTMNNRLEALIAEMPEQYYWVHKRFKTRPAGQPSVYTGR